MAASVVLTATVTRGALVVTVIPLLVVMIALLQSDQGPIALLLKARPIQFLGRISYSIYMVHVLIVGGIVIALNRLLPLAFHRNVLNYWTGDLLVAATIVTVLGAATATYTYVEEPGRLFGRRAS